MKNNLLKSLFILFFTLSNWAYAQDEKTLFTWEEEPLASAYLLEVKDSNENIIVKEKTTKNFYSVRLLETGVYFYRVTVFNRFGLEEDQSNWFKFSFQKISVPQLEAIVPNTIPEKRATQIEAEGKLFDASNSLYMTKFADLEKSSKRKKKKDSTSGRKINLRNEVISATAMKILIPKGVRHGKYNFTFVHETGEEFLYNIPLTVTKTKKIDFLRLWEFPTIFIPFQKPMTHFISFGFGLDVRLGLRPFLTLKTSQLHGFEIGIASGAFLMFRSSKKMINFGFMVPIAAYIGYGIPIKKKVEIFPYIDMGVDNYFLMLNSKYHMLYPNGTVFLRYSKITFGVLIISPPIEKIFFSGGLGFTLLISQKSKFEGSGIYFNLGAGISF